MLATIEEMLKTAAAESQRQTSTTFAKLLFKAARESGFREVDGETVRRGEYELKIASPEIIKRLAGSYRKAGSLLVRSVPEVVGEHAAGALVLRYPLSEGALLLPFDETDLVPAVEATDALKEDLRKLAAVGMTNSYVRGPFYWLISSDAKQVFLNSWEGMRECQPVEAEQMLEQVDRRREIAMQQRENSRIHQVFGTSRVLLPVVHPVSREEALASVQVAVTAGCKGVWLINQGMSEREVMQLVLEVRGKHPSLWVGLNLLGHSPAEALEMALRGCEGRIDGIWSDNAGIDEASEKQPRAQEFVSARERLKWEGLYFGGVAFKYQREVTAEALPKAVEIATRYMDVVCTSGPGTGQKADPAKAATMRKAMGAAGSLALASGVTDENVQDYLPHVNAYLVGTGIEHSFGVLDAKRVTALQAAIAAYR